MDVHLAISPASSSVDPDSLVAVNQTVTLVPSVERYSWPAGGQVPCGGAPNIQTLTPKFFLWFQAPGGVPVDATADLIGNPLSPSFVARRGTYFAQVKPGPNQMLLPDDYQRFASMRIDAVPCGAWYSIGPTPNSASGLAAGGPAGRVLDIAIDESVPRFYAATRGGVWRSDDRGLYWYPMTDEEPKGFPPGLAVGRLAVAYGIHPAGTERRVYAGSGDRDGDAAPAEIQGLFASDDGGITWVALPLDYAGSPVARILADPRVPSRVFVATKTSVWRSDTWGDTWTDISPSPPVLGFDDLALSNGPNDKVHLFAAVAHQLGQVQSICDAVLELDDAGIGPADGGMGGVWPWHTLPQPAGVLPACNDLRLASQPVDIRLAAGVSASPAKEFVYAAASNGDTHDLSIYFRENDTWSGNRIPNTPPGDPFIPFSNAKDVCGDQCYVFDLAIAVDPSNPHHVVVGGQGYSSTAYSYNGGGTWLPLSPGAVGAGPWDVHALTFFGPAILAGADSGVSAISSILDPDPNDVRHHFNCATPLGCWTFQNFGLTNGLFYSAHGSSAPRGSGTEIGGLQDNGVQRRSLGRNWANVVGSDGVSTAIDAHDDPGSPAIAYYSYTGGDPDNVITRVTLPNGAKQVVGSASPLLRYGPVESQESTFWSDPELPGVMLVSGRDDQQLYIGTSFDTFQGAGPATLTCFDPTPGVSDDKVSLVVRSGNHDHPSYFVVTHRQDAQNVDHWGLYQIYPWSPLAPIFPCSWNNGVGNAVVTRFVADFLHPIFDIATDPEDPEGSSLYLTAGRRSVYHLVPDAGNSWTQSYIGSLPPGAGGGEPPDVHLAKLPIAYPKATPGKLTVGGEGGIYTATRGGDGLWGAFNRDLFFPGAFVTSLRPLAGSPAVRASTYGRGVWEQVACLPNGSPPGTGPDAGAADGGANGTGGGTTYGGGASDASSVLLHMSRFNTLFAAPELKVDVGYHYAAPGTSTSPATVRVTPTIAGVPSWAFFSSQPIVTAGDGTAIVRITLAGTGTTPVVDTDGLRVELIAPDWTTVLAREDVPVELHWRPAGALGMRVAAELMPNEGAPSPVSASFTVSGAVGPSLVLSGSFASASAGAVLSVTAPGTIATPAGPAVFSGWAVGWDPAAATDHLSDSDFSSPAASIYLQKDVDLRARYRLAPNGGTGP